MHALSSIVELALVLFSSWTLAFQICLFARVPALVAYPLFLCFAAVALWVDRAGTWSALRNARWTSRLTLCTLCVASGLALSSLVANRPHVEDALLFHRGMVQVDQLDQPFIMYNTLVNDPSITMSGMFAMMSYEMGMALLAKAVGGDALWFCQHIGQMLASFLLPIVYVLLFHRFGLRGLRAVAATLLVLLFLLLDGNVGMSFGHFAFTNLKMGKGILFTLMVPTTLLCTLRYLNRPTRRRLSRIVMCGVCGVGLSASAVFLLPVLVFVTTASYLVSFGLGKRRIGRAFIANLGSAYCVLVAGLILAGLITSPHDTSVWDNFVGRVTWTSNLLYVLQNRATLQRDFAILLLLPLIGLPFPWRRYLIAYSFVAVAVFANPVTGPILLKLLTAGAYHRLLYALPLPLCFGLLVNCVPRTRAEWQSLLGFIPVAWAVLAATLALGKVILIWLRQLLPRIASNASIKVLFEGLDLKSLRPIVTQISASLWGMRRVGLSLASRLTVAVVTVTALWNAFDHSVLEFTGFKRISQYSLPAAERDLCLYLAESIRPSAYVLSPYEIQAVLVLLRPDLRFETEGWAKTIHSFRNNHREEEAKLRARALMLVEPPQERTLGITFRRKSPVVDSVLQHGVEYVILDKSRLDRWTWEFDERGIKYDELGRRGRTILLGIRRETDTENHKQPQG